MNIASVYPYINAYITKPVTVNTSPTPLDPTTDFKTFVNKIIGAITLIAAPMSYEPKTVLLQLEELRKELKDDASNYQAHVSNPRD